MPAPYYSGNPTYPYNNGQFSNQTQLPVTYSGFTYNYPTLANYIPGRIVQNEKDITPQEVPMNGSIAVFPLNDNSSVILKTWNSDGTIKTVRYVPESESGATDDISVRLDNLEQRLSKLEYNKKKVYREPDRRGNYSERSGSNRSDDHNLQRAEVIDNA